jgi:hypothetical protein
MDNNNDELLKETEYNIKLAKKEHAQYIHYVDEIENIDCIYEIEDLEYSTPEEEKYIYDIRGTIEENLSGINEHIKEIRNLINELYDIKLKYLSYKDKQ